MVSLRQEKQFLRRRIDWIWQLTPQAEIERRQSYFDQLAALPQWQAAKKIGIYHPFSTELDFFSAWGKNAHALKELNCSHTSKLFFYPVENEGALCYQAFSADCPLIWKKGKSPALNKNLPVLAPLELDAIVVPALAVDAAGYRLGRGGGYYDRLLSVTQGKIFTMSIIPDFAFFSCLPNEPWDQKIHCSFVCSLYNVRTVFFSV